MNLRIATLALCLAAPFGATQAATVWATDNAASTLEFSGSADGEAFTGKFAKFDAKIEFDANDLQHSSFTVSIDLTSADSGNSDRDETLQGEEFFDTATTSGATYAASRFSRKDDGSFSANGDLTLNGITKPVPLHFTWTADAKSATLVGEATIDRTEFDVGTGDWAEADTIAHEVKVKTTLKLGTQ